MLLLNLLKGTMIMQLGSSFSMGSNQRRAPWYWLPIVILLLAVLLPSLEGSRSRKRRQANGRRRAERLDARRLECWSASPALQGLPGAAPGAMLPPSLVEPNSTHHHTAYRRGEGDAFCDAAANSCCVARGWCQLGLRRTMAPPPYRPRRKLGVLVGEKHIHLE